MLDTLRCLFNSKCRAALNSARRLRGWNADEGEARKACLTLIDHISGTFKACRSIKFTTAPIPPYYFMQVHIERELHPYIVIKNGEGVVDKDNPTSAIREFLIYIDILHKDVPEDIALMTCSFHADVTDFLMTFRAEPEGSWPAIDPPEFRRNDDGSATLTYALKRDGRSVAVTRCTLHIAPDYTVTLDMDRN